MKQVAVEDLLLEDIGMPYHMAGGDSVIQYRGWFIINGLLC